MPDTARRQRRSIALLSAAAFVSAATLRVADPLLPQVAEEFSVGPGSASVIATAFSLSYGLCQIFYGPLGDRLGKLQVITAMMFLSAVTVGLSALAPTLPVLGLLRLLGGATAAAVIPLSLAYIGDVVDYADRQTTLARYLTGQVLGLIFGQVFGGVLGEVMGWREIFLLIAGFYVLVGLLLFADLRANRAHRGAVPPAPRRGMLAPYVDVAMLPWARVVLLTVFLEGVLFFGAFAFVGAYLRDGHNLGYATIGLLLGCFGLGGLSYTMTVKTLVPRLGERGMALVGGGAIATALLVLAIDLPVLAYAPVIAVIGFGLYMLHNTLQTNATQMAPAQRGAAVSFFASCYFLGQAAGVALGGAAIEWVGYAPVFIAAATGTLAISVWFRQRLVDRPSSRPVSRPVSR